MHGFRSELVVQPGEPATPGARAWANAVTPGGAPDFARQDVQVLVQLQRLGLPVQTVGVERHDDVAAWVEHLQTAARRASNGVSGNAPSCGCSRERCADGLTATTCSPRIVGGARRRDHRVELFQDPTSGTGTRWRRRKARPRRPRRPSRAHHRRRGAQKHAFNPQCDCNAVNRSSSARSRPHRIRVTAGSRLSCRTRPAPPPSLANACTWPSKNALLSLMPYACANERPVWDSRSMPVGSHPCHTGGRQHVRLGGFQRLTAAFSWRS